MQAARLSTPELLQDIVVLLFAQQRPTLGQATHLAGMGQYRFQHLLACREIPLHYRLEEFKADLAVLNGSAAGTKPTVP